MEVNRGVEATTQDLVYMCQTRVGNNSLFVNGTIVTNALTSS